MNINLDSTNALMDENSSNFIRGAYGVKTGTSYLAGACLVFAVKSMGRDIIGVTLFAGPAEYPVRYCDAKIMIDWATQLGTADTPRPRVELDNVL